ncbi:MAG: DUF3566 domain-containing protein [Actinomycetota bacterium]|nr:DUF3566 domain-containing protein [Actinomycetota bacterium]
MVRRVEPWTVLKFSVLLYVTMYLVILVAGIALWAAASATGLRHNVEKFIGDLIASDHFTILGATVAKASVVGGALLVAMGTGANVLLTVLYNLIADVVGGVVVLFEERPGRRRGVRVAEAGESAAPLTPSRQVRRRETRVRAPREQSSGSEPPMSLEPERVEPVDVTRPVD